MGSPRDPRSPEISRRYSQFGGVERKRLPGSIGPCWVDGRRMPPTTPNWTPGAPGRAVVVAPHPDDEVFGAGGLCTTSAAPAGRDGGGRHRRRGCLRLAVAGGAALAGRRRAEQASGTGGARAGRRATSIAWACPTATWHATRPLSPTAWAAGSRRPLAADHLAPRRPPRPRGHRPRRRRGWPPTSAWPWPSSRSGAGRGALARQWRRWPLADATRAAKRAAIAAFASQLEPSPARPARRAGVARRAVAAAPTRCCSCDPRTRPSTSKTATATTPTRGASPAASTSSAATTSPWPRCHGSATAAPSSRRAPSAS